MTKWQSFSLERLYPEDWGNTPETVKRLVESLIANATLSENESRLIQFLDATPIGIAVHDATGQIIYINQLGRSLLGIDRSSQVDLNQLAEFFQIYQLGTRQLYPVNDLPSTRALAGEATWADDLEIHQGERVTPLEVWATPIFDDQGRLVYAIAAFQDISERKKLEAEQNRRDLEKQIVENTRLKRESHYRQMIQAQTDLILRSRPDTTITFANNALCLALGRDLDEVIGMQWSHFVLPEELEAIEQKIAALTPENSIFENINQDYRPNHQIGWTHWINLGIFNEHQQLIEIQSVGRDITILQEKILREQALNRVFQAIHNSLDLDTIFATATAETARLLKNLNCFVVQYLPALGIWRHVAEFCHDPNIPSRNGFEIPDAGNPFAEQLKQFQRVQVEDTSRLNDAINQEVAQTIPGAWLLIPLVVKGNLWGSFTVSTSQRPFIWHKEQIELAQSVADHLEIAIQQANLYQQVQLELEERCRVEGALRDSEQRFRQLFELTPKIAVQGYNHQRQVIYWNYASEELYGYTKSEALGRQLEDLIIPLEMRQEVIAAVQRWLTTGQVIPASELSLIRKDGSRVAVYSSHMMLVNSEGEQEMYCVDIDLRDRKQAEEALRESENRYRLLAENMNDLVCLHDLQGRYLYVSPSCESLLGYRYDEMLEQDPYVFFHPDDRDRIYQETHVAALGGKPTPITYRILHKSGHYVWFETLTKPVLNRAGEIVHLQTTSRDVTERIQAQTQLKHDALHDALTKLPNRHLLIDRLELAINRTKRCENYQFAVLFLDLDRFKVINDSLGHLAGDQLLIAIAQKLQTTIRSIDLAARLGGDEFVILLEDVKDIQEAVRATERIFAALQAPLIIESREVYTTFSIGIVLGTNDYAQTSDLLRDADIAMYRAKSKGKARYEIFDVEMHTQALNRLHLENDLRRAIEHQEFVLYYQPIVALDTQALVGFEALIRWQHPTQGLKLPGDFIAVAEETGLITRLDYWALWTACEQLAAWQVAFPEFAAIKMSVNLSAQDLQRSDLLDEVDRVLAQTKLQGNCLALEITESMLIEDIESTIALLSQLKEREIQISIDDFGTGYSSLNYLHCLPIDNLKVDRTFVNQIQTGKRNHQIVETIAALTNQLELNAIAEGIETQQQIERLQYLGYQFGQGYFFSKPLTPEAAEALLANPNLIHRGNNGGSESAGTTL